LLACPSSLQYPPSTDGETGFGRLRETIRDGMRMCAALSGTWIGRHESQSC
jgi:hypothetical protein